jgi:hypothetical protein
MQQPPTYTPEEANALLPWLRQTLADLRSVQQNIELSGLVLQRLAAHQRRRSAATVAEDMRMAERAIATGRERLRDLIVEITGRGIELRDMSFGLVDFPGERNGNPVWLCWRTDETSVSHWHEIDRGFADRQPL